MAYAAGQDRSRSTGRSIGGQGRSTARSTDVHNVHNKGMVDRTVDRGKRAIDRSVDQLKHGCSLLGPVDRAGRPAGRPAYTFLLTFLDSDSFSSLGSNPIRVPKILGFCGYK